MHRSGTRTPRRLALLACPLLAAALVASPAALVASPAAPAAETSPSEPQRWVGTWSTALTAPGSDPLPATVLEDQTLRQVVHTSVEGGSVRVRLSNEHGTRPLRIGEAHVALSSGTGGGTGTVPGSDRRLTFGGQRAVTIPAGAPALSDPVPLQVPALSDVAISTYLPQRTRATSVHGSAYQRNFIVDGNRTGRTALQGAEVTTSWNFLSGVSVTAAPDARSVVTLGDSITDGAITTVDANHRWPDFLARRLQAREDLADVGVLNKGIGGNRLLWDGRTIAGPFQGIGPLFGESALRRFDRDVLAQPGVEYVTVLLGINDIGQPGSIAPASEAVSVRQLIAGYRQLIARAHERGLRIYGATLTPFEDTTIPGYYSAAAERKRDAVNRWIRTSGEWDAVIDFDRAVRDPQHPNRMLPRYDSGDHLHPNDAGMRAMAAAVPLRLFTEQHAPVRAAG